MLSFAAFTNSQAPGITQRMSTAASTAKVVFCPRPQAWFCRKAS